MKVLMPGRVVVVLQGRQAGKKAVIVRNYSEGTAKAKFPHCLVVGVERAPLKVSSKMRKNLIKKRSTVKPFIKVVNYSHVLPTRYSVPVNSEQGDLREIVKRANVESPGLKKFAKRRAKAVLQKRHRAGLDRWFFTKLRF